MVSYFIYKNGIKFDEIMTTVDATTEDVFKKWLSDKGFDEVCRNIKQIDETSFSVEVKDGLVLNIKYEDE